MRDYINSIIELFEDYKTSKLDINKVQQIKISIKFKNKFPDKIKIINEINDSIKEIKNMLIKIKRQSNNIIKNNKNKVNKYLSLMGIPYEFNESAYDIESKTASYSLFLKEDKEKKDRKNGLSYGERNIISLILDADKIVLSFRSIINGLVSFLKAVYGISISFVSSLIKSLHAHTTLFLLPSLHIPKMVL